MMAAERTDIEVVPQKTGRRSIVINKGYQHVISQVSEELGSFQERIFEADLELAYHILDNHPEVAEIEIVSTPSTLTFQFSESGFLRRSHELKIDRTIGARAIRFAR